MWIQNFLVTCCVISFHKKISLFKCTKVFQSFWQYICLYTQLDPHQHKYRLRQKIYQHHIGYCSTTLVLLIFSCHAADNCEEKCYKTDSHLLCFVKVINTSYPDILLIPLITANTTLTDHF